MTHQIYSQQQLQLKSIARLKQIYSQIACTVEVSDKRCKDAWITAIVDYQSTQAQKLAPAAPDEQTLAQAELDSYITKQAQAVAPEELRIEEISFDYHEYYAGNQLIASITHDDDHLTQPWVVMVKGVEKFRANTWARCHRFIQWHHKQGTLNTLPIPQGQELTFLEISYYDQEVHIGDYHADSYLVASISFDHDNYEDLYWRVMINAQEIYRDITPALCYEYIKQQYQQGTLPVQEQLPEEEAEGQGGRGAEGKEFVQGISSAPLLPPTTGNEIMAQIFVECEKFGFEILDDGIYHNDIKLGEVGQTEGSWWFTRATDEIQQRIPCDSALDAVWWLSMVEGLTDAEVTACEQLLDLPFEQLTAQDWQRLREHKPLAA